jgi:hypothetical protein
MTLLRAVPIALLLALALASPAFAARVGNYEVGISEGNFGVFDDQRFQATEMKHARLIVPWDTLDRGGSHAEKIDGWLSRAQALGIEPLVSFAHSERNGRERFLPSKRTFQRIFLQFREQYPWITTYSPWNEINHRSQPTWSNPRRAADYYNVVRANCPGCKIVAADILDMPRMERYVRTFKRYARGKPRIWGLHNYSDTNRRYSWSRSGTRKYLRLAPGEIWFTETGGLVNFPRRGFRYSESRAADSTEYMFALATKAKRVRRIYVYTWFPAYDDTSWDSGLVDPDLKLRPAYRVVWDHLQALRERNGQPQLNPPEDLPRRP